jgi:import receptor subunit TOM22
MVSFYDLLQDETLSERLWGLTEMFPEPLRNVTRSLTDFSVNSSKWLYQTGRVAVWVVASSAAILALPVMFESERAQMEEQQLQQQRQVGFPSAFSGVSAFFLSLFQIMLGPNAAISGQAGMMGGRPGMPPMPAVSPPAR